MNFHNSAWAENVEASKNSRFWAFPTLQTATLQICALAQMLERLHWDWWRCAPAQMVEMLHKRGKCTYRPTLMLERYCTLKRGKCTIVHTGRRECWRDIEPQEKRSQPRSDPGAPVCTIQSTVATLVCANFSGNISQIFIWDVHSQIGFRCLFSESSSHVSILTCPS